MVVTKPKESIQQSEELPPLKLSPKEEEDKPVSTKLPTFAFSLKTMTLLNFNIPAFSYYANVCMYVIVIVNTLHLS